MLPLRRPFALVAAFTALGLALPGCGPKHPETFPVTGTVTLDGQPVAGAAVVFIPEQGEMATATTDTAGRFELSTFERADGALPGRHRVTVVKTTVEPGDDKKIVFLIPKEYGNPKTSPLTWDVQKEMGPVQLALRTQPEPASPAAPPVSPPAAEPSQSGNSAEPAAEAAPAP